MLGKYCLASSYSHIHSFFHVSSMDGAIIKVNVLGEPTKHVLTKFGCSPHSSFIFYLFISNCRGHHNATATFIIKLAQSSQNKY